MKFLILTVTTGQGHNQTASALKDEISSRNHEAYVLDVFEYISSALKSSVSFGYLFSTSVSPRAYGRLYRAAEKKDPDGILKIKKIANSKKITEFINQAAPDVIILTHVLAAFTFSKENLTCDPKVAGIITDFTIHPMWNETSLDYYVLPNELLCYQARKKGLFGELLPFGIPIKPQFAEKKDKHEARAELGIPDRTTVLVMSGSMGYGKVYKNLIRLNAMDESFNIISVCGNNDDLKGKIDKKNMKKVVKNYGFTDKISLLMDAADIIVTKPGGITTSEALAKRLPLIIANPIPGHEDRNCEFLLNTGTAIKATETYKIDEALSMILESEKRIDTMVEATDIIRKPYAAKTLINFFEEKD